MTTKKIYGDKIAIEVLQPVTLGDGQLIVST